MFHFRKWPTALRPCTRGRGVVPTWANEQEHCRIRENIFKKDAAAAHIRQRRGGRRERNSECETAGRTDGYCVTTFLDAADGPQGLPYIISNICQLLPFLVAALDTRRVPFFSSNRHDLHAYHDFSHLQIFYCKPASFYHVRWAKPRPLVVSHELALNICPTSIAPQTQSIVPDMKDVSASSAKLARNTHIYPKKRPSPHGISKTQRTPFLPVHAQACRSPRSAKSALIQQRQREAAALALKRDGVLLEEEYREEIRCYMHDMERHTMSSTQSMDQQPEIKWHMRPCLVDFLVEVHFSFRLRPETLYLTLNIVDRYVSRRVVHIKHYQLVGCAALWVAAKFEDAKEKVPTVQDLVQMCHGAYEETAFIQMEGHILTTIQWTLGHPTAEAWLRLMCCETCMEEPKVQHVARFLMEITLFYREFVKFAPSSIALASLTLARFLCEKPRRVWEETEECLEIVDLLDNRLAKHVNGLSETLVKKYSYAFYSKAATFTVQFYLQGGRFVRQVVTPVPVTPTRSALASAVSTPMSTTTSVSDVSDDFPLTPSTPALPMNDANFATFHGVVDKENIPSNFEPVFHKIKADSPPEQYLPHDFVTFGRTSLYNLHVSPRAILS